MLKTTVCLLSLSLIGVSSAFAAEKETNTKTTISDNELKQQFQKLDKDGDGKINEEEAEKIEALSSDFKTIAKKDEMVSQSEYNDWVRTGAGSEGKMSDRKDSSHQGGLIDYGPAESNPTPGHIPSKEEKKQ